MMKFKGAATAAVFTAVALAGSGSAHAGPTATVDGITFPIGFNVTGSDQLQVTTIYEDQVKFVGDVLNGIGEVSVINPALGGAPTWIQGANGVNLYYTFTGYTVASITGSASSSTIDFTGGTVNFYVTPSSLALPSGAGYATDLADITSSGTLFLGDTAVTNAATGYTLVSTINGLTTSFTNGSSVGFAYLDVTGGDAAAEFATKSVPNVDSGGTTTGFVDEYYTSSFTYGAPGGYAISGSASIKANANAIPEPGSIGIVGMGLLGLGALVRRRRRS